jgi:hypothetical protein
MDHAGNQALMLSENVELVKCPKEVVPSLVRAQRFDDQNLGPGQPSFALDAVKWVKHVLMRPENWKVSIAAQCYPIAGRERRSQEVQCAAERPDYCADLSMEDGRQWLVCARYGHHFSMRRIEVDRRYVDVGLLPRAESPGEDWKLGVTPINRPTSVEQIIAHTEYNSSQRLGQK